MGEALRKSVKSSALFNEALDTILLKLLRAVAVYRATCVSLYESMRAGVGLVTRVRSMEGGDDVKQLRRLERWNFGSRGLILQLRFLSLTINLDNQPRMFDRYLTPHTTVSWSLFAGVDHLLPGLDCRVTLSVIAKDKIYARKHFGGKSACATTNTAYLVLVSLHSADRRSCRSTVSSEQCFNACCRLFGQSP